MQTGDCVKNEGVLTSNIREGQEDERRNEYLKELTRMTRHQCGTGAVGVRNKTGGELYYSVGVDKTSNAAEKQEICGCG